jgi:hypothetical protein
MWLHIYPITPIAKLQVYLTPDQYVRIKYHTCALLICAHHT